MAKATIEYDLDDPEDVRMFHLATKAINYQLFVWDFSNEVVRPLWKNGIPEEINSAEEMLEHLQAEFGRLYDEYGLESPD